MELVAVVAILGILAGFSLPVFFKVWKSTRIDQAKALLNSSIASCLEEYRKNPAATEIPVSDDTLSSLESAGYAVSNSKKNCADFMVSPVDPNEDYMFPIGFMVRSGKVTKIAIPARDRASESACKAWGKCGIPPELQAEWDRIAKLEADKKACNDSFYEFLNTGSKGQKNIWDDSAQSCSRAQWALDGTRYTTQEAYQAAFTAKVGKACIEKFNAYSTSNPQNGRYTDTECEIDTHFLNGNDLETSDPVIYEAKFLEYNNQQCDAAESKWLEDGKAGAFSWPTGLSCTAKWKCPSENNSVYTDQSSYTASQCGTPPKPPCNEPHKPAICRLRPSLPICALKCQ